MEKHTPWSPHLKSQRDQGNPEAGCHWGVPRPHWDLMTHWKATEDQEKLSYSWQWFIMVKRFRLKSAKARCSSGKVRETPGISFHVASPSGSCEGRAYFSQEDFLFGVGGLFIFVWLIVLMADLQTSNLPEVRLIPPGPRSPSLVILLHSQHDRGLGPQANAHSQETRYSKDLEPTSGESAKGCVFFGTCGVWQT